MRCFFILKYDRKCIVLASLRKIMKSEVAKRSIDNFLSDKIDLISLCVSTLSFSQTPQLLIAIFLAEMVRKCTNKIYGVRLIYISLESGLVAASVSAERLLAVKCSTLINIKPLQVSHYDCSLHIEGTASGI